MILIVDPGKAAIGYCTVDELGRGRLIACGFREFSTRYELGCWARNMGERAVCELPRSAIKSKSSMAIQNDLLDVSLTAGAISGVLPTAFIRPSGWKGEVPKKIHQPRILQALAGRPEAPEIERQLGFIRSGIRHNVIDAIGIAIWYLEQGPGSRGQEAVRPLTSA